VSRLSPVGAAAVALVATVLAPGASPARRDASPAPLATSLSDFGIRTADYRRFLARARAAGATAVRIDLDWAETVGAARPTPREQADPAFEGYDWSDTDRRLVEIARSGLEPIAEIGDAPSWAERPLPTGATPAPRGGANVDPDAYGRFAKAAARRYSGGFEGLPRVRYWDAWNEPNISLFLGPQFVGGKPYSPALYRAMLNAFASGVKSAAPGNLVIAGETAPFRDITPEVKRIDGDWGPLSFMRRLLCLSRALHPTCKARATFDIWAHHPYTSGGPLHHAALPDDVSIADLGKMKAVLDAAFRAGHVRTSKGRPQFWVGEFGWDSNPPDPAGVPMGLLTRWVAEGLYRMWAAGVTQVTWLQLVDEPLARSFNQGGLYARGVSFAAARPKPILRAFEFPFVAVPAGGEATVWGRAPAGDARSVVVEQRTAAGAWRRLGVVQAGARGTFEATLPLRGTGDLRARVAGEGASVPYALAEPQDRFYNPFGETTRLEPRPKKRG